MYASELWCNFKKSCMERLHLAYNFRCRALYRGFANTFLHNPKNIFLNSRDPNIS